MSSCQGSRHKNKSDELCGRFWGSFGAKGPRETHSFLENIIYQSSQKQCGSLGLGFAAVFIKNPLSANLEELVVL